MYNFFLKIPSFITTFFVFTSGFDDEHHKNEQERNRVVEESAKDEVHAACQRE